MKTGEGCHFKIGLQQGVFCIVFFFGFGPLSCNGQLLVSICILFLLQQIVTILPSYQDFAFLFKI